MHVLWGKNKQNTVFAIGKSILNKSSKTDIGKLCLENGGGGHEAAGTCQVENLRADDVLKDLIRRINKDG
jgi:nanoRNase/pAp phosphatase (c-di-AMP/oligoRNAs hydrolase)